MPGKAAKVWITERQQPILIELSKSRTESQLVVQRATIVLRAFAGRLNEQIAAEIGLGPGQVGVWRRRWQAAWEELTALECREPRRLREARSGSVPRRPAEWLTRHIQRRPGDADSGPGLRAAGKIRASDYPLDPEGIARRGAEAGDCPDFRVPSGPLSETSRAATAAAEDVAQHERERSGCRG